MLTHFSLVHWYEPLNLSTLSLDDSSDTVSCVCVCVCFALPSTTKLFKA